MQTNDAVGTGPEDIKEHPEFIEVTLTRTKKSGPDKKRVIAKAYMCYCCDLVDDGFESVEVEGSDILLNNLFQIHGGLKLSGDFFHQGPSLFLHGAGGNDFKLSECTVVNKTADQRDCLQLRADTIPDNGMGGGL